MTGHENKIKNTPYTYKYKEYTNNMSYYICKYSTYNISIILVTAFLRIQMKFPQYFENINKETINSPSKT